MIRRFLFGSLWVLTACGASDAAGSSPEISPDGGQVDSYAEVGSDVAAGSDVASDNSTDGPIAKYIFHLRTNSEAFVHTDAYVGQTSRNTKQGIRSFYLLRDSNDKNPVMVFNHGNGYVEAGYDAGNETIVGEANVSSVPVGHYSIARVGVTHSRFKVSSTLHYGAMPIVGDFDCVQALSDNTEIDGQIRNRGWYKYIFQTAGQSYPQEGNNAPLPTNPTTGGFTLINIDSQSFYEFPVDLAVDQIPSHDLNVAIDVNMDRSFRWEDQSLAGYTKEIFDSTPVGSEPIRRFGANSAKMLVLSP